MPTATVISRGTVGNIELNRYNPTASLIQANSARENPIDSMPGLSSWRVAASAVATLTKGKRMGRGRLLFEVNAAAAESHGTTINVMRAPTAPTVPANIMGSYCEK